MAQAFRRLGSEVALFEMAPQVLPREDADAASILAARLRREGVRLLLGCRLARVERRGAERLLHLAGADGPETVAVDALLVAAGRAANVEALGLEAAGVAHAPGRGVQVDDTLRTTNRRIFAAGDVCLDWKFTHAAEATARIAVTNALFPSRRRLSRLVMPWCTYTDPEVARVGLSAREARERGIEIASHRVPLDRVNRAVVDGEDEGFVEIHTRLGSSRIVGATIVAAHAGEMISEVTLAMVAGLGLGTLLGTVHPYPTQAEGIARVAGLWFRERLTPVAARLLRGWMALRR
jgi:pyruvate/2-oxoglutarate dehydrogenase complex dihydrolipoamide dehydrogenase (E3) component